MPRLTDPSAIRVLLETDRPWAVYALGDLSPSLFARSEWFHAPGPAPALVLLFRGFDIPVLFALGEPRAVLPLLDEIAAEPQFYLHVRPDLVPLLESRYEVRGRKDQWRMLLAPADWRPAVTEGTTPLRPDDLPALQALYADGEATGEAPEFFFPAMLDAGVYFGAWEANELVAAAGTHLVEPAEGVAAIGNVYTRRDRRGLGLAGRLTGAVAAELLRRELRTVALNVNQGNGPAIRVYQRLGFARYCDFVEGLAVRR
jgi:GNAT superfamily N-acetyltransferase